MRNRLTIIFIIALCLVPTVFATTTPETDENEIQQKISEKNDQIRILEEEIRQYNVETEKISNQAQTLQGTIQTLDLTQKKISTDLVLTDRKISKTTLGIDQTTGEISDTTKIINRNHLSIQNMLQQQLMLDDTNLIMLISSVDRLNDLWTHMDNMQDLRAQIKVKSDELSKLKVSLIEKQKTLEKSKRELAYLKTDLKGKKQTIESTKQEKASLLKETKNKESVFKEIIKTKEEQKAQFEKEVFEFESQLNIAIDKTKYAEAGIGTLSWPLDDVYITQKFGRTVGAQKLYVSGSHNGVDFRAPIGTRVRSVLDGTVAGTGNTDIYPGCYSFGKWVMVRHPNGLSSIYGHLSNISVKKGDDVSTGDIIGYSGNTGYSTGPHLHLGIYATQGVRIEQFTQSRGCKKAVIPLADVKAYLDPLQYLPKL
jgi:murein DD-endopeptidase MepM/ murein hydrolase activator NlpD